MRCQTPSRYVSHAIVRLIGSALAASAPSTCGTMVEKRPLPISEERRRETSLSRFFIQNPFFSKKADQKGKNMVIALHCLFFVFIERFIQCLADYRYLSLSNMPFFALPLALSSLIGSRSLGLRTEPASAYPFPRKINGVGGRVGGHDRSFPLINSSVN